MSELNLLFADGNKLISYNDDTYHTPGCPTCDYGSQYVNDISIVTTNYHINIVFNQMYEFAFSTADAIAIFAVDLSNMTEQDFINHIDKRIHEHDALEIYTVTRRNKS